MRGSNCLGLHVRPQFFRFVTREIKDLVLSLLLFLRACHLCFFECVATLPLRLWSGVEEHQAGVHHGHLPPALPEVAGALGRLRLVTRLACFFFTFCR